MADNFQEVMLGSFTDPSTGTANVVQNNQLGLFADRSARVDGSNDGVEVMDAGSNTIIRQPDRGRVPGDRHLRVEQQHCRQEPDRLDHSNPLGPDFGSANQGISILGGPCPFTAAASGNVIGDRRPTEAPSRFGPDNIAVDADSNTVSYNTVRGSLITASRPPAARTRSGRRTWSPTMAFPPLGLRSIAGPGTRSLRTRSTGTRPRHRPHQDDRPPASRRTMQAAAASTATRAERPAELPDHRECDRGRELGSVQYDLQSISPTAYTVEFFASPTCDAAATARARPTSAATTPTSERPQQSTFMATFTTLPRGRPERRGDHGHGDEPDRQHVRILALRDRLRPRCGAARGQSPSPRPRRRSWPAPRR